jgi:hypothetical protein
MEHIQHLVGLLQQNLPEVTVDIDEPINPKACYWLDIEYHNRLLVVQYQPGQGFGIFAEDAGYGEGPYATCAHPEQASTAIVQILTQAK